MSSETFADLVMRVHGEMGGRASAEDVATHVATAIDGETYRDLTRKGFVGAVRAALRRRSADTGLPEAPCVGGEYVQDALLTSEDLRELARQSTKRGRDFFARAQAYADRHLDTYGVAIDPATGEDIADAGYAQPTALGVAALFLLAVLVGLTTRPGVALATVVAFALGRLAFLLGRAALDSERKRSRLVAVEIYPALSRADAARAIEGWHR